jgi:hypothetical protein
VRSPLEADAVPLSDLFEAQPANANSNTTTADTTHTVFRSDTAAAPEIDESRTDSLINAQRFRRYCATERERKISDLLSPALSSQGGEGEGPASLGILPARIRLGNTSINARERSLSETKSRWDFLIIAQRFNAG